MDNLKFPYNVSSSDSYIISIFGEEGYKIIIDVIFFLFNYINCCFINGWNSSHSYTDFLAKRQQTLLK